MKKKLVITCLCIAALSGVAAIFYGLYYRNQHYMPVDADDPGVPGWITEETTLGELVTAEDGTARGLVYEKWYHLVRTYPPKKAVMELVKYVEALPCISKVELDTVENEYYAVLLVTSKKGKLLGMIFSPPPQ